MKASANSPPTTTPAPVFLATQASTFFGNLPTGVGATILVALTLLFLLRDHVPPLELAWWGAAIGASSMLRLALYMAYRKAPDRDLKPLRWMTLGLAGNLLGGLSWGASIFLFNFDWPLPQQLFLILALAGVTAGAIPAYASVYPALLAFHLPASLPAILFFLARPEVSSRSLGFIIAVYAASLALIGYIHHRSVVRSLKLLDDNEQLLEQVTAAHNRLEQALEQKHRVMEALHDEKERIQVTLHSIADGVITTDREGKIQYLNPIAEQLTGWSNEAARGMPLDRVFRIEELQLCFGNNADRRHGSEPNLAEQISNQRLNRRDGSFFYINSKTSPIHASDGSEIGTVTVFHDVTVQHQLAERLSFQAAHDALTGLLNRTEFERHVEGALQSARRTGSTHVVCYLDLDQFKVVNDTCGHVAGDELLRRLARGVTRLLRKGDVFARLGGDEFGFLLRDCTTDQAREFAERVRIYIRDYRFSWEGRLFELGASIGLMGIEASSESLASILSAADIACYTAKELGRDQIHVYQCSDEEIGRRHSEIRLVSDISRAIEQNRLELYFQEIVPTDPGAQRALRGELTVRMRTAEGDLLSPSQFLPAAKRYNLISSIDLWVVRNALSWYTDLRKRNEQPDPALLSINLSGASLARKSFMKKILALIDDYQIPRDVICFEITEAAAISDLESAQTFMNVLRESGVSFALDDFGSGLSSFAYLKNLPVDYLKIDGSLVRGIASDPIDRQLVNMIHQLGHVMGVRTIAEFVENDDVRTALAEIGIDYIQGFGISPPAPLSERPATVPGGTAPLAAKKTEIS